MYVETIKIDAKRRFNQAAKYGLLTTGLAVAATASYLYGLPYAPLTLGLTAVFTGYKTARFLEQGLRYKREGICREETRLVR